MHTRVADAFKAHPMVNQKHLDLKSMKELPESHAWLSQDGSPSYGSSSSEQVPVINLKDPNAMKLVGHACKTWGVFQVTNHGVPTNLLEEMEAAGRKLFALPIQQKLKAARAPDGVSGYGVARISSFFPKLMWSEGFTIIGSPYEHARKLWPNRYSRFCDVIEGYKHEMNNLAQRLMWLMLGSLGVTTEDVKWDGSQGSCPALQLNSYPACPDPDRAMGLAAHTDSTLLTILYQNNTSGLQAHREGAGWVTVPPIPGALVVNVGDLLHILSNGLYPSVLHRAMVNRTQHRLSVAYLYGPPSNVQISPLSKLTDHVHPPLYRPVTWSEYPLLHRFGILGPDGGPGVGLSEGLDRLSAGPFSKLFKPSSHKSIEEKDSGYLQLGTPDDVDVLLELKDWLFALEGADVAESLFFNREEGSWHTTFESFKVKANSRKSRLVNGKNNSKHPIESVTVGVEGLKTLKPQQQHKGVVPSNGHKERVEPHGGVDLEADIVLSEDDGVNGVINWVVESLKFSVKHPVEAIVTKDELQHVAKLCKSEVDSMGRITAGVLRVLKLEGSIGQTAMDQLSNLGSEGFDKIFSANSNGSSSVVGLSPSSLLASDDKRSTSLGSTLSSLEVALLDTHTNCTALAANLSTSESTKPHLHSVQELTLKLESMQKLLAKLQTQL